jgi:hypothetical protein
MALQGTRESLSSLNAKPDAPILNGRENRPQRPLSVRERQEVQEVLPG